MIFNHFNYLIVLSDWRNMRKFLLYVLCAGLFLFLSCDKDLNSYDDEIKIVTWNVQTFFDAEVSGTEYSDFIKNKNWNKDVYLKRVERLCSFMKTIDADVFVFEEIENENVVFDISNMLCNGSSFGKSDFQFSSFCKKDDSAIGCAVFSKFELKNIKCHFLDVQVFEKVQPSMRYLMQVDVFTGKKDVRLFVNHWKSKANEDGLSEVWRDWQESVLALQIRDSVDEDDCKRIILCGDFNRDLDDFVKSDEFDDEDVFLRGAGFGKSDSVIVKTAWNDNPIGSYYYNESWEKIDQIFLYGDCDLLSFEVLAYSPWADESGIPIEFKIYNGEGFSDHLPLMAIVRLE